MIARGEVDIVEHRRGDVARAQILGAGDRRAGRYAALGAVERVGDIGEVGELCRTIDRSVADERARNFPGRVIGELAAKAEVALPDRKSVLLGKRVSVRED